MIAGGRAALVEDLALIVMLLLCFGAVVGMTIKVQELKEAPSWSIAMYMLPIAWAAAILALQPHKALRAALLGGPLLLFVLWALLSYQWSSQPALSMRQGLLYCCTYMIACVLAARLPWWRVGRVLGGVCAVQAFASAALALGKPEWGVMTEIYPGAWSGLWTFKQSLGIAMAMGLALLAGHSLAMPQARIWTVPSMAVMALCVVQSEATTALLVSVLALAATGAVWMAQRHPAAAVFAAWAVIASAVTGVFALTFMSSLFFEMVGKAPTLTGRTDIWAALDGAIAARPDFGWGYQAFWTDNSLTSPVDEIEAAMDGFRPPDAHSTPLDIRLQLGLGGLGLAAAMFARGWWQALSLAVREPGMLMAVPLLVTVTSICFTESMGLYPMDFGTLLIMLVLVKTALTVWDHKGEREGHGEFR